MTLRRVVASFAGALVAGVLVGAVSRLLMALVALAGSGHSELTWAGSAGIALIYAAFMLPGALLAVFVRRGRWALLAAGAAALLFPAVGVAGDEIGSTGGFSALTWVLVSLAGLGVFATIAALPVVTLRLVDATSSRLGVPARRPAGETIGRVGPGRTGGPVAPPA
jgi:hypothetical protein